MHYDEMMTHSEASLDSFIGVNVYKYKCESLLNKST